jgi:hypothetical protein
MIFGLPKALLKVKDASYVCINCIEWDTVLKLEPPTEEQKLDIARIWKDDNAN